MSSSSSEATSAPRPPCAACKHRRVNCEPDCVFAPYFPPEHADRFAVVHEAYGASNVSKLLDELPQEQRAHAVAMLVFEARAAKKYPVYRSVYYIVLLQRQLKERQAQLAAAREDLAWYVTAAAAKLAGAVRVAGGSQAGVVVGTGSGVQRGQGQPQPQPNEQVKQQRAEEAREAATAARAARKRAMVELRAAPAQQQDRRVRHRAVVQHAGTGPVLPDQRVHGPPRPRGQQQQLAPFPNGRVHEPPRHQTAQQMADEVARVQSLLAVQEQAEEEVARQQEMMMRQALAAAREQNYPHQAQEAGQYQQQAMGFGPAPGQMALQLAAAEEEIAREQQQQEMMMLQQQAGLDFTLLGHGQQKVQRFSAPTVRVATEEQDMNLMQQAAAFARAMSWNVSGATNMAASLPGGSADAGPFLVQQQPQQPQPVNALGFQTDASLPPPLADLPRQQQGDGGANGQFDIQAYFATPAPNRPPEAEDRDDDPS